MLTLHDVKQNYMHIKLFFILIFLSFPNVLLANQTGYYILKFKINQNDIINLEKKTYVDTPLKISKLKGHHHDNFVYKLKKASYKTPFNLIIIFNLV